MGHNACSDQHASGFTPSLSGRRGIIQLLGLSLTMPLVACGQTARKEIWLNVVMNSCVDRIHTNIFFNNTTLGVTTKFGTTGTIADVRIPFEAQSLQWTLGGPKGTPRNGETMTARNQLTISPEQIPAGTRYLGIHLFPDDTVEFTFAEGLPERTAKGEEILAARKEENN